MADASFWTHAAQMSRLTRGNLRTYAAQAVRGLTAAKLNSTDSAELNRIINQVCEEWRAEYPGLKGYGERQSEETWNTANTRHELPADFAELGSNGRITLLDTSGNEDTQLEVITKRAYEEQWWDGTNYYEERVDPIALLWGFSSDGKRFLEIRPTPTTAIQFRVYYIAYLENLDNDNDELEAPLPLHVGIKNDVAADFALYAGSNKEDRLRGKAERVREKLDNPVADERKRPARVLTFEEVGGYTAYENAE